MEGRQGVAVGEDCVVVDDVVELLEGGAGTGGRIVATPGSRLNSGAPAARTTRQQAIANTQWNGNGRFLLNE